VSGDISVAVTVVEPPGVTVVGDIRVRVTGVIGVTGTTSGVIVVAVAALFSVRPACPAGRAVETR